MMILISFFIFFFPTYGMEIERQQKKEESPLLNWDLYKKDPAQTERLIKAGENPNVYYKSGYTPLDMAIIERKEKLVALLIFHGANPNHKRRTRDGNSSSSILHTAAVFANRSIIRNLFAYGAKLDTKEMNESINSPLWQTIRNNSDNDDNVDCVRLLLANGADAEYEHQYPSSKGDAIELARLHRRPRFGKMLIYFTGIKKNLRLVGKQKNILLPEEIIQIIAQYCMCEPYKEPVSQSSKEKNWCLIL